MKTIINFIIYVSIFVLISGCAIPVYTKVEMQARQAGEPLKKDANYIELAHYWDDYAEKQMIDFKGASFLTIRERRACRNYNWKRSLLWNDRTQKNR